LQVGHPHPHVRSQFCPSPPSHGVRCLSPHFHPGSPVVEKTTCFSSIPSPAPPLPCFRGCRKAVFCFLGTVGLRLVFVCLSNHLLSPCDLLVRGTAFGDNQPVLFISSGHCGSLPLLPFWGGNPSHLLDHLFLALLWIFEITILGV